jgi:8-oxo-dGTP diphosphatase
VDCYESVTSRSAGSSVPGGAILWRRGRAHYTRSISAAQGGRATDERPGTRHGGGRRDRATGDGRRGRGAPDPSPHREDWTFPKGKVEPGETDEACALREVEEETGLRCELGDELPTIAHVDHKGRRKVVRYWVMRAIGGEAAPHNEVDAVRWLTVAEAARTLTYPRDRQLLEALTTGVR